MVQSSLKQLYSLPFRSKSLTDWRSCWYECRSQLTQTFLKIGCIFQICRDRGFSLRLKSKHTALLRRIFISYCFRSVFTIKNSLYSFNAQAVDTLKSVPRAHSRRTVLLIQRNETMQHGGFATSKQHWFFRS